MDDYSSEGTEEQYFLRSVFFLQLSWKVGLAISEKDVWYCEHCLYDNGNNSCRYCAVKYHDLILEQTTNTAFQCLWYFVSSLQSQGRTQKTDFVTPNRQLAGCEPIFTEFDLIKGYKKCTRLDSLITPLKQTNALWRRLSFKANRGPASHWPD